MRALRRAAVLGAGVMGGAIAAHLANAGIPVLLLDLDPGLVAAGVDRVARSQPPALFTPARAQLIETGTFDADLGRIGGVDWIIEAVVENLEIKRALLERVEAHWREGTVISTNTSGLPVHEVAAGRSDAFRRHFLGTHFFNPPRYLKLLEIIPLAQTDPVVADAAAGWGDVRLGKGIVYAHDRPNFIANRIGSYGFRKAVQLMLELGLSIEEVDELTGPLIGRPRSATFRTTDLVGLDTVINVSENSYRNLPDDDEREVFAVPPLFREMAARGWLGEKSGSGFYRRVDGEIQVLDYATMEYRPRRKVTLPSVEAARLVDDPVKRLRQLLAATDTGGQFLWRLISDLLVYAAKRIPEIADDVVNVDRAMRWGYAWDAGPFETWDRLDVAGTASRLDAEGRDVPPLVRAVLDRGTGAFYRSGAGGREYFDLTLADYRAEPGRPGVLVLAEVKSAGRVVADNAGASLVDLGDGIACLEFHSKLNTIGEDTIRMMQRAMEVVRQQFDGLVIGNQAVDFSAGANLMLLLLEAQDGNWDDLDLAVRGFQRVNLALRYFEKPVVAAPFGRTLAGGCEMILPAARVQAAAESYIGLVETGVGLIPAGGGTTEMVRRATARIPAGTDADPSPFVRWVFETIALAKVSSSAEDARALGYLRDADGISMNGARLIADAKEAALALVRLGHRPPLRELIPVVGERGLGGLETYLYLMRTAGQISEYDEVVGRKLAHVVCGGRVAYRTLVSEAYLHDLEREAFLSLIGERKTQDRMRHTLQTGRPLRN
ncbi:MAG TPA: 3-hydroxyacyl-CoA dehydrogenase/enoyl-CoA hydratase family protein [bacterium]